MEWTQRISQAHGFVEHPDSIIQGVAVYRRWFYSEFNSYHLFDVYVLNWQGAIQGKKFTLVLRCMALVTIVLLCSCRSTSPICNHHLRFVYLCARAQEMGCSDMKARATGILFNQWSSQRFRNSQTNSPTTTRIKFFYTLLSCLPHRSSSKSPAHHRLPFLSRGSTHGPFLHRTFLLKPLSF